MLRWAQVFKKCTILGNLRTITQERKKEIRQRTLFFSSTFWALTVYDVHFGIWKLPEFISMGSSFRPFWSPKYLNVGGVSCKIRILSRSIQETYSLRKVKILVLLFLSSWEPNLSDLMVYFCLFQNAILHRVEGKVLKPIFLRMQFSLVATFFLYFRLSVWVKIYIWNFLISFYHLYHLTFGDKSVSESDLRISNYLTWSQMTFPNI